VERQGGDVVYLNDLRHQEGTATKLRFPLGRGEVPATRAALGGTGTIAARDYRGVPVLAAFRPVPGSAWALVAKIDEDEAFAALRQSEVLLWIILGTLVFGAAVTLLLLSSRQTAARYRDQKCALEERDRNRTRLLEVEQRAAEAVRRRDEALRESVERIRLAAEAAELGTWEWDIAAGRLTWDERSKELLGLPPATEVSYALFERMLHPDDRRLVQEAIDRALASLGEYHVEYRVLLPDGRIRWISARGRVSADPGGLPYRMIGVALDATQRRAFEGALARAEAAELAERAKSDFLALASHELHTPLNAILGYAELLLDEIDGPVNEEQRRSVERIVAHGRRLVALADGILELSRIGRAEVGLACDDFGLREQVVDCLVEYEDRALRKGLDLRSSFQAGLPERLRGDPQRLVQVLRLLLDNALKFTEEGGVTVEVRPDWQQGEGRCLRFTVADTGPGIPPEKQLTIFRAFEQAEPHATRTHEGLGLGLAICRSLVEKMGGKLWVESEPGKGSAFRFTLCFECPTAVSEEGRRAA
jgi:PAS domain S-box-containing protein